MNDICVITESVYKNDKNNTLIAKFVREASLDADAAKRRLVLWVKYSDNKKYEYEYRALFDDYVYRYSNGRVQSIWAIEKVSQF
jgi:hypothetical protein